MRCVKPILIPNGGLTVSCGQCIGCRLKKKRDWAIRLMNENNYHKESCFLTLTYDNKNMPLNNSLKKEHLTKFLKKLRSNLDRKAKKLKTKIKIRYFACGEYGEGKGIRKGRNPHYHLIIFGKDFRDFKNKIKDNLYLPTKEIKETWKYGFSSVGGVSIDSCKYVANYVCKKVNGNQEEIYKKEGRIPEFSLCSRKPGIGNKYYKDNIEPKYQKGVGLVFQEKTVYKNVKVSLPKYYKDKDRKIKNWFQKYKIKEHEEKIENIEKYMEEIEKKENKTGVNKFKIIIEKNNQTKINYESKEKMFTKESI